LTFLLKLDFFFLKLPHYFYWHIIIHINEVGCDISMLVYNK
jgi:hypothetical protein